MMRMSDSRLRSIFILSFIILFINLSCVLAISPTGANVTSVSNSTTSPDTPQSHAAVAGNVSELNLVGYSVTQSWQGYYGNVSGTIQLADSSDNILYNWSLASPEGEIYASINSTVSWTNVQCFNYTASGTFASDAGNAGGISQFGMNLTMLEGNYSIALEDVDGVNETFTLSGAGTHDNFYTNNLNFSEGECSNTRVYSDNGVGVNNEFEEALLYDPLGRNVIFTSILDENVLGYDGAAHDFEMLVLEDGHGSNTTTTTYYFYVEIQ
ncbi:MAG TPA: hypothetical protein VJH92_04185 [Candidatus Nanoarchaeia archaeon]|nr:hypothetical protein [Candidatus Nanoarchaeia archaeon]